MNQIENLVTDKGSKYAASGAVVLSREDVQRFLKQLKRKKKYAKATHNTWAVILEDGTQIKDDDGESGAGAIMLKILDQQNITNHLIVVTRWYGGVHLGADRFRHIRTCVQAYSKAFLKRRVVPNIE